MLEYHPETYYVLLMTLNVSVTLVVMLAACLCCKKKEPKNELLGLEGMVKLKNPDEVLVVAAVGNSESQADLNLSTVSNADSEKRASTAAHRSLPDIPIAESNADNGSELYETVADKHLTDSLLNRDKSPAPSLKQQASVSQHSSISQADDISSPYSRVKNSPHDYAKVRATEHPYAQLNTTSSASAASNSQLALNNIVNNNDAQHLNRSSNHNLNESLPAEIPAASAIAGIIAASQDLPYMTPPIASQHFSGDSQDSSKGYTSISVREPLANILAQQPLKSDHRKPQLSRDISDSHYATVSDDSDETYAAIEDPNVRHVAHIAGSSSSAAAVDIYTSGSETYAQIQPIPSNSIIVSVEINNAGPSSSTAPASSSSSLAFEHSSSNIHSSLALNNNHIKNVSEQIPTLPPVDSLRAQMHSRQASSSSNTSSMGNLGSPKPEKRQANSPLPPTPKSIDSQQQQFLSSSNSNLTSGRNSVISVIDCSAMGVLDSSGGSSANAAPSDESPQRKSLSPSKDIEGMYAKVMKKNKFARNASSSQNNSPIMTRKYNDHDATTSMGGSSLDSTAAELTEAQQILALNSDRNRMRSNSYSIKDHGYETIPADTARTSVGIGLENRKSDCYANILQKERQMEGASELSNLKLTHSKPPISGNELVFRSDKDYATIAGPPNINKQINSRNSDPGYETLLKPKLGSDNLDNEKKSSDYDPNYEELKMPKYNSSIISSATLSDDGYAKVVEKHPITIDEDSLDGYSKVKGADMEDSTTGGYSTIGEVLKPNENSESNHNYASILETKANDTDSDHYARIAETTEKPVLLQLNSIATPAQADNLDIKISRPPELPITPSSLTSSSLMAHSSTTSSSNMTSTTSTLSSRQTPSSQYESLTGSDTDPNYESVCYSNASSRENPYERLHTDYSDTQLSTPITPEDRSSHLRSPSDAQQITQSISNGSKPPSTSSTDLSETLVVDDYFQV